MSVATGEDVIGADVVEVGDATGADVVVVGDNIGAGVSRSGKECMYQYMHLLVGMICYLPVIHL